MFLIISPASLLSFLVYACLIVLWCPHCFASRRILFVPKHCSCGYLRCVWVACIIPMRPEVVFVVVFFSIVSVGHFGFCFFSREYGCPPFFPPFTSVFLVYATTLRLHSSACSAWIWYSCCLNFVDIFPFVVVSSVNAASRAAVADAEFMRASFISPCVSLLDLPHPAASDVWSSSSLSRCASW